MITRLWADVPEDERSTRRPHDRDGQCAGATKYDDMRNPNNPVLWHQCSYDAMQGSTFCKAHHPDSWCPNVTKIEEVKDFDQHRYRKAQKRGRCAKCNKWTVITAAGKLRRHFKDRTTFDEDFENRPRCRACGIEMVQIGHDDPGDGCETCTNKYPPALLKACGDEFDYAVGTADGSVIRFHSAAIAGDWVLLQGIRGFSFSSMPGSAADYYSFERGINVRFEDIRWVADAPQGS